MVWLWIADNRKSLWSLRNSKLHSDLQCIPIGSLKPFHKEIWLTPTSVILSDIICLCNINLKKLWIAEGKLLLVWETFSKQKN